MKIQATNVFKRNLDAYQDTLIRIIFNQGGARSSKTYSILQILIFVVAFENTGLTITIVRKSATTLKDTVMRDFFELLENADLYNEKDHNKTYSTYTLNGNLFEFRGLDEPQKKRGAKRHILYINEANEITFEDWFQLNIRTETKIFLDFNPSEEYHFLYTDVLTRIDCRFIQSSYLDNPFIPASLKYELELLKDKDENAWNIYGKGERGITIEKIYSNWRVCKEWLTNFDETIYGLDFGWNNPTALIEVNIKDAEDYYLKEMLHQSFLTNTQLIEKLVVLIPNKNNYIYADCAEPARIEEIKQAGFNVYPADKSVKDGIDFLKNKNLYIDPQSIETTKEFQMYSWKKNKDGIILDEPIKAFNHSADAVRYAGYTHSKQTGLKIFVG